MTRPDDTKRTALETGRDLVTNPDVSDAQFSAVFGAALRELGVPDPGYENEDGS